MIPLCAPSITIRDADAAASAVLSEGPCIGGYIEQFEQQLADYVGRSHVVAVNSGTAAIELALLINGVQQGDEVWCSTFTFIGSAVGAHHIGAKLVFVDSNPQTWNMDSELAINELRRRAERGVAQPKAIIVVDIYGNGEDWTELEIECRKNGVAIIEDACESLGAVVHNRKAGQFGDVSCFSFNGNKLITTGGGGAFATDDPVWAAQARWISSQCKGNADPYHHIHVGNNWRMPNVNAAIGVNQIEKISKHLEKKRHIRSKYASKLAGYACFQGQRPCDTSSCWMSVAMVDRPRELAEYLKNKGIETRFAWHPLHSQICFAGSKCIGGGNFAHKLHKECICLPSSVGLKDHDQDTVINSVLSFYREMN
jgi:dTDP-4-amino-4,6-dideoxygalactose transaminase